MNKLRMSLLGLAAWASSFMASAEGPASAAVPSPPAAPVEATVEFARVLDCVRANLPSALQVRDFELRTRPRGAPEHTLKGELFAMRERSDAGATPVRAMLRVSSPAYLAGAAYLAREAEDQPGGMYVFLPSIGRVRRITGTFAAGSLLGTAFSYEDFKLLQNTFAGMKGSLERAQDLGGRTTHVLKFEAVPGETPPVYSATRVWVDRTTCVPLMADFYQGETLRKQLITPVSGLKQDGGLWFPSQIDMHDLKEDTVSVLRITGVRRSQELPARYFDLERFYLPDPPANGS